MRVWWFPSESELASLGFESYCPWREVGKKPTPRAAPHFRLKDRPDRVLVRMNEVGGFRLVQTTPITTPRFDSWPGCVFTGSVASLSQLHELLLAAEWLAPNQPQP